MSTRRAFWFAWSLWSFSVGVLVFEFLFGLVTRNLQSGTASDLATGAVTLLFVVVFATMGALLAWKRPSNPIGWLLASSALCYALGGVAEIVLKHYRDTRAYGEWMSSWVWGVGIALSGSFVLLLFPTGSLPSRRWRPVAWAAGICTGAFVIGQAFAPGAIEGTTSRNPFGIAGPTGGVFRFLQLGIAGVLLSGLVAIVSVALRFRRARSPEREQLKWLVYAVGLVFLAALSQIPIDAAYGPSAFATNLNNTIISAAFVLVPVAIGVAVLRYRLYDIDVVINKTVVYGLLAGFITAVYVGIVVGIGALIGSRGKPNLGLSILATAVVAVGFQPVRSRIQRFANRLVYGKRATPYEVLSEFSERMAGAYAAEDLLPRMARILAEGTGAHTARVWLHIGGELKAEAAWPRQDAQPRAVPAGDGRLPDLPDATAVYPVRHRDELLGALALSKAPGDRLTPAEDKLAADLAAQAGLVLRNVRLTEELLARLDELQASRKRLVAAQDSERRRLERNIHDGAQQQLVALAIGLRLARGLVQSDVQRSTEVLEAVEADVSQALQDLRDLARGIYPPLLADQGLPAALEAQARRAAVPVAVHAEGIGRYSQDAEAAVYFCVLEALQNVAKYAGASSVSVRLDQDGGDIRFEVADDGAGFDPKARGYGTGLQGMADRLAALGGTLEVRTAPGAGTTVAGRLPVGFSAAAEPSATELAQV